MPVNTLREILLNHYTEKSEKVYSFGQLICYIICQGLKISFIGYVYRVQQILCSDFEHFAFWPFYGQNPIWPPFSAVFQPLNGQKVKFLKSLHQMCRIPYIQRS